MALYDKIKELCDQNNVAVTAVEKELGWGRGSIGKLRKNGIMASDRLQAIAEYFGVSTDYLLDVQNDVQPQGYYLNEETAQYAQEIFDNPNLRALFDAARDISKKDQKMLVDMAIRFKETNPDG